MKCSFMIRITWVGQHAITKKKNDFYSKYAIWYNLGHHSTWPSPKYQLLIKIKLCNYCVMTTFLLWAVHKWRHQSRGRGIAKRWSYLKNLSSKNDDQGRGRVKNLKKLMTSIMNGSLFLITVVLFCISNWICRSLLFICTFFGVFLEKENNKITSSL